MKLAALILFFTPIAFAQAPSRHFIYLGGGGDPEGETTIFDYKIERLGNFVRRSEGMNTSVSFNGGHTQTEKLLRSNFTGDVTNFSPQNFENVISRYEQQIRNGDVPPGGQMMVMIDSHGSEPTSSSRTHYVSSGGRATNLLSLAGGSRVNLDRLENLAKLAQEKNIKLAILDFSCHSGASLSLANSSTCVIAASGPQSFAYGGASATAFSNAFVNRMAPGKNLEEIYLEARMASTDMGFPMISTAEGVRAQSEIYPVLRRYLNAHELTSDKFGPEIENSVMTNRCLEEAAEVETLLNLSRQVELSQRNVNLESFRTALTNYSDYRRTLQDRLGNTGQHEMREICGTNNICNMVAQRDILAMNPEQMITQYQNELTRAWTPQMKDRARNWLVYYQNAKRIRDELNRNQRSAGGALNTLVKTFPEITRITADLARQVAIESRKLYSTLYRPAQDSACRGFRL